MIKIYIFADSYKHFEQAINEYEKRLWKSVSIIKLKPSKRADSKEIIRQETENIIKKLEKEKWYKIVLSPWVKDLDTSQFSKLITDKKVEFSWIVFIIWWAFWFNYDVLEKRIDLKLGLWKYTMPHSLALLVLLEQIYRAEMINKNTSYHK